MRSKLPIALLLVIAAAGCADGREITSTEPGAPSFDGGTLGPGGRASDSTSVGVSTQDGGGTFGPGGRQ
jgi:hypothetical protein